MATPELTKGWIQYLKNNQIVAMQSEPSTGKLKYNRKVTADDVKHFLQNNTQFDKAAIDKALASIKPTANLPATQQSNQPAAGAPDQPQQSNQPRQPQQPPKKQYDNSDAEDVEPRYGPRPTLPAPRRPTLPAPRRAVREAFVDDEGPGLSEDDIEGIFDMLSAAAAEKPEGEETPPAAPNRREEINKLKRVIRDQMTEAQRRSLWAALNDTEEAAPPETVTESEITGPEINAIFKSAVELRNKPKSKWEFFKKDKQPVSIEDLKREYEKERPDDLRDIKLMLKNMGYDEKEINKVLGDVFGQDDEGEHNTPAASPTILKIAKYVKDNNMAEDIITFMRREYPDVFKESVMPKKVMIRDIERIFEGIVKEDRNGITKIKQVHEYNRLGRNRK